MVNVGFCWDENGSVEEGSAGNKLDGGLRGRDGYETLPGLVNVGFCWDENVSVDEGSAGGLRGRDGNETLMRVMSVLRFGIRDWMTTRSQLVFLFVGRDV